MSETTTGYTPTDEEREAVTAAFFGPPGAWAKCEPQVQAIYREDVTAILANIGPIVERERRAAKVEALAERDEARAALDRVRAAADEKGSGFPYVQTREIYAAVDGLRA